MLIFFRNLNNNMLRSNTDSTYARSSAPPYGVTPAAMVAVERSRRCHGRKLHWWIAGLAALVVLAVVVRPPVIQYAVLACDDIGVYVCICVFAFAIACVNVVCGYVCLVLCVLCVLISACIGVRV